MSKHVSLIPDSRHNMASCLTVLLPFLPHPSKPFRPQAGISLSTLDLRFVYYLSTEVRKVTNTPSHGPFLGSVVHLLAQKTSHTTVPLSRSPPTQRLCSTPCLNFHVYFLDLKRLGL